MKRIIFSLLVVISIFVLSGNRQVFSAEKKMAVNAGLGLTYPLGDMGDIIDYALPLLGSFQYAVQPNISLEGDFYYYVYTSEAESIIKSYKQYQIGAGVRFWFTGGFKKGSTYDGIYLGAGLARTNVEVETEFPSLTFDPATFTFVQTTETSKGDDNFTTLVLKGGYVMKMSNILMDFGLRYDAIDMKDWFDQPVTVYAMASFLF